MRSLILSLLIIGAGANLLAPGTLERRAPYAGGGWGLVVTDTGSGCPAGTSGKELVWQGGNQGATLCCPNGFSQPVSQDAGSYACCPQGK
jgi:hypothetical protein